MYTQISHLALARARNEARHLNIGLTDTGHLLLALAQEKMALARKLLEKAGIPQNKIEENVERFYRRLTRLSRHSVKKIPPISNSLFLALEWAEEEALHGGYEFIGTPQLMLGLLKLESSSACRVLKRFGLSASQMAVLILALNDETEAAAAQPSVQWILTWYLRQQVSQTRANAFGAFPSRNLRALLLQAKERALLEGLECASSAHLLRAFLEEDPDTREFMQAEGFDENALLRAAETVPSENEDVPAFSLRSGMIFLDPAIKSALSWAHGAACERKENLYGTLNLLSALLADEKGIFAEIFRRSGFAPAEVRRLLKRWIEIRFPSTN